MWPEDGLERVEACPACGARERRVLHAALRDRLFAAPGSWDLQECLACGSAFLDPRPTEASIGLAYERYFGAERPLEAGSIGSRRAAILNGHLNRALGYDLHPSSRLAWLVPLFPKRRWRAEWSVRHLRRPPGAARLLDVGCGTGEFLVRMREAGWEVAGIEPDAASAEIARSKGLDVQQAGLGDARLDDGAFAAITLNHVLEHLHDPRAALERCRALLRPGGVVWIATPNIASLGHARFGRDWFGLDPPRHLVLFSPRALEDALAGFAEIRRIRAYRADLTYPASEALHGGGDALSARGASTASRLADARSFLQPDRAEELTVTATAPGDGG